MPTLAQLVDGVGLGPAAPGWSLGPRGLDQLLTVGAEEGGQPSAVAAGALYGPAAPAWHMAAGEAEQFPVAGGVGPGSGLTQEAPDRAEDCGGQGVTVAINADEAIDELSQGGHVVAPFWDGRGRCRPGRKHRAAEL